MKTITLHSWLNANHIKISLSGGEVCVSRPGGVWPEEIKHAFYDGATKHKFVIAEFEGNLKLARWGGPKQGWIAPTQEEEVIWRRQIDTIRQDQIK